VQTEHKEKGVEDTLMSIHIPQSFLALQTKDGKEEKTETNETWLNAKEITAL
jgi:hypothetical protein